MGRDILPKVGISLQQTKQQGRQIHHVSSIENGILKWQFKKYTHLCTPLGRFKKPYIQIIIQRKAQPKTTKRRKGSITSVRNSRTETRQIINDKQRIRLEKWPDGVLISPLGVRVKKDK